MTLPAPFHAHEAVVRPEWIDRNGHLNLAYYIVIFDQATDALFEALAIGSRFSDRTGTSLFIVETHTTYECELKCDERVQVNAILLGCDGKRLHFAHEMFAASGVRAASHELMALHVDMQTRRSVPFPPDIRSRLEGAVSAHRTVRLTPITGRSISLRAKTN